MSIRSIHERLGTAGFIISIIALVAALGGSAFAAKGALTHKQKKEVKNIAQKEAKKYAGKPGAPGATGPAGAAGPTGKEGPAGKNGEKGDPGTAGADGKSVEAENAPLAKCSEGGTVFKVGGTEVGKACNGEEGTPGARGPEGSPWTAGGTLPKGSTEKGDWGVTIVKNFEGGHAGKTAISFGIPLKSAPTLEYLTEGEGHTTNCPGTAAEPEAAEGFLCVYTTEQLLTSLEEDSASAVGAYLSLAGGSLGETEVYGVTATGTWAVTSSE